MVLVKHLLLIILGKIVWIAVVDAEGEYNEYLPGTIDEYNEKTKQCKIIYSDSTKTGDEWVDGDRVEQRDANRRGYDDDLVNITPLNQGEVLKNIEDHYWNDDQYIDCGPTLIAINLMGPVSWPWAELSKGEDWKLTWVEFQDQAFAYARGETEGPLKPGIEYSCAKAYRNFNLTKHAQANCVSGESGAGKSYSTTKAMKFITTILKDHESTLEIPLEKTIIDDLTPIVEQFGNAQTVRNPDSSRFGKYFNLICDMDRKCIVGATIQKYLLEKSRINEQDKGERNYHIFYGLCKGVEDPVLLDRYGLNNNNGKLSDMTKWNYLNTSGVYDCAKNPDKEKYLGILDSFKDCGMSPEENDMCWKICGAVLNIGNMTIDPKTYVEGKSAPTVVQDNFFTTACKLLGMDHDLLIRGLTLNVKHLPGGKVMESPNSPANVDQYRHAWAKDSFNHLFNWMILRLNSRIEPETYPSNFSTFGLLDIFGFECFSYNKIEQFCINYTNEKLQN